MAGNRKKAEAVLLAGIKRVSQDMSNNNLEIYQDLLKDMNDAEFDALMVRIEQDGLVLPIFIPAMSGDKLSVDTLVALCEEMDVEAFSHLILTDPLTGMVYKTPKKYLVLELPVRRQSQHYVKKASTPDSTKVVDHLSGQATGESKGAAISVPELLVLDAKGHDQSILEMIKVNGGDEEAYKSMREQIDQTGGFSLKPIMDLNSRPKAISTFKSILLGMHIDSNI